MTTPVADVNGDGTLAHASALQEAYDMLHLAPPDEPPRRRTLQESYDLQVAEAVDSTAAESPCKGVAPCADGASHALDRARAGGAGGQFRRGQCLR